jgi:hypothetical protein
LVAALLAVDGAGLGGVALRAPACPLRTDWLALLRGLLPAATPFRRLPLHASSAALLGGLDLSASLHHGRVQAQPGLLAQAHQGWLVLGMAERAIRRRSMVFVVSDFISAPGWEDALGRLARRHEVMAVRLFDPLEMSLPDVGLVTLEDAETGEQLFVDSTDTAFRARYERIAAEREATLLQALARSGADTLELATDDDLLESLLRCVQLRRQRARQRTSARFPAMLREPAAAP